MVELNRYQSDVVSANIGKTVYTEEGEKVTVLGYAKGTKGDKILVYSPKRGYDFAISFDKLYLSPPQKNQEYVGYTDVRGATGIVKTGVEKEKEQPVNYTPADQQQIFLAQKQRILEEGGGFSTTTPEGQEAVGQIKYESITTQEQIKEYPRSYLISNIPVVSDLGQRAVSGQQTIEQQTQFTPATPKESFYKYGALAFGSIITAPERFVVGIEQTGYNLFELGRQSGFEFMETKNPFKAREKAFSLIYAGGVKAGGQLVEQIRTPQGAIEFGTDVGFSFVAGGIATKPIKYLTEREIITARTTIPKGTIYQVYPKTKTFIIRAELETEVLKSPTRIERGIERISFGRFKAFSKIEKPVKSDVFLYGTYKEAGETIQADIVGRATTGKKNLILGGKSVGKLERETVLMENELTGERLTQTQSVGLGYIEATNPNPKGVLSSNNFAVAYGKTKDFGEKIQLNDEIMVNRFKTSGLTINNKGFVSGYNTKVFQIVNTGEEFPFSFTRKFPVEKPLLKTKPFTFDTVGIPSYMQSTRKLTTLEPPKALSGAVTPVVKASAKNIEQGFFSARQSPGFKFYDGFATQEPTFFRTRTPTRTRNLTNVRENLASGTRLRERQQLRSQNFTKNAFNVKNMEKNREITPVAFGVRSLERQQTKQRQRLLYYESFKQPTNIKVPNIPVYPNIPNRPFGKRFLDLDFSFKKETKKQLKKRPKRPKYNYKPSLASGELRIFGKQPKRITGIEIRPILRRKRW